MRIKTGNINFRNEVNILNPKELFQWLFSEQYEDGFLLKLDGIGITSFRGREYLNKSQTEELNKFIEKYKDILPRNVLELREELK